MDLTHDAIGPLLSALADVPVVREKALQFPPAAQARFHEVGKDCLTWDWCDRHAGERGKASLAYYDVDGQIVGVGICTDSNNQVTEIELWRGDGQPLQSIPTVADLWEMVPGVVYSPRS